MSNLKHKYKELKRLQNKIMEKDNFVNDINYKIDDLKEDCIDSLKSTVNISIEDIVYEYYEKYPYIDDFLIEANNSIENELNRLYEKVQQEEIENKERFNNLFGGLI
ncbi:MULTISPECIES: hypothetical protein [Clostridia]|jgi:hypothetical protein|uniref:hypothetical protein n=1 Tax=Clostridia TaxID=186801 RepID=UPI0018AC09E3|nr:hypothetical protein [Clostridium sp. 1001270J_160509_D11]